jgi:hypothetical protein
MIAGELPDGDLQIEFVPRCWVRHERSMHGTGAGSCCWEQGLQKCGMIANIRADEQLEARGTEDQLVEIEQRLSAVVCELRFDLPENVLNERQVLPVNR